MTGKYSAEQIKVLEGLEGVRKRFNVVELSKKIKRKGDILILSNKLKIKPRILNSAVDEGRVLSILPNIDKSKAGILASLRTDRELKIFLQKYDLSQISARKLIRLSRKWREELQKNPLILLTQEEHDLIIGTLMGDASIRKREKNSCFRVSHSIKQEEYIKLKLDLLKNFNVSEFSYTERMIKNRKMKMINLSTNTHQVFNYYRNLFYKNKKKTITSDVLNQLNPKSLAFWICDDGSFCKRQRYFILCTNSYSLEEHRLIKEFFKEKFGLNPTIGFRDKKYYYLRFTKKDSEKLIEIIKFYIPESMKYKIGKIQNG